MSSYYRIIKRIHDEWERNFVKFVESLKKERICIVLFGSRARGDDNLLSDFDLLIVMENKIKIETDFPADIFCYTTREVLDEIEKGNTIVLDALTQGKLILDNMNIFKSLQEKARNKINRDKLIRLKMGWFRVH